MFFRGEIGGDHRTMADIPGYEDLVGEDLAVAHPRWGRIHLRNKRPARKTSFDARHIVILQHGATYGSAAFDMRFAGLSWMDYLAQRGFDAYCLDLPGYGKSDRPQIMDQPAQANPPFMRTPEASECLGHVVKFVLERRNVHQVCLVGWSWGTAITSLYAGQNPDQVARLALYAPVWDRSGSGPSAIHVDGDIGAYRTVTRDATLARRQSGLDAAQKAWVMPREWFDRWWQETAASDPQSDGTTIRAPNGVVQDGAEYWNVGRPLYDPGLVAAPVLITVGEWDADTPPYMAQTLYPLFNNAAWKRLTVLSGGTHSLMMEHNRILLFRTVQQFLEEEAPGRTVLT